MGELSAVRSAFRRSSPIHASRYFSFFFSLSLSLSLHFVLLSQCLPASSTVAISRGTHTGFRVGSEPSMLMTQGVSRRSLVSQGQWTMLRPLMCFQLCTWFTVPPRSENRAQTVSILMSIRGKFRVVRYATIKIQKRMQHANLHARVVFFFFFCLLNLRDETFDSRIEFWTIRSNFEATAILKRWKRSYKSSKGKLNPSWFPGNCRIFVFGWLNASSLKSCTRSFVYSNCFHYFVRAVLIDSARCQIRKRNDATCAIYLWQTNL